MGDQINSVYADYAPVVNSEETMILFTSRRDNTTGGDLDAYEKYFEDIYYSLNIDGKWTKAINYDSTSKYMNSEINTNDHDAVITFAADETQLYIYREEDVWISKLVDGQWTVPMRDDSRVNSEKGFEPSVFITDDQQTMFVVSELPSGFGGRDIYMTKRDANGKWKQLTSLGKVINTKFDEDAPFLTPDGNTLYFASNGHNSMGDYDIFKTVLDENGNWTIPVNLGPPINTPGHDRYFVTTDEGAIGYYASDRDGGYGETDIYRIILDCKAVSATIIKGIVYSEDQQGPVSASITIFDGGNGKLINRYEADSKDGKYEMRLKTETKYRFRIEAAGYLPHSGEFEVPKQCEYYDLFQEIKIDNVEDSAGRIMAQRALINNAFFDIDSRINEDFKSIDPSRADEAIRDSLRMVVAETYNPIELTNFVQSIDILDPSGVRLATEIIGSADVATIQVRDEEKRLFNKNVVSADQYYYNDNLPEARANYVIANVIDESSAYPQQQISAIDKKLKDAPVEAFLATIAEVDESEMVSFSWDPEDSGAMKLDWEMPAMNTSVTDEPVAEPIKETASITPPPVAEVEPIEEVSTPVVVEEPAVIAEEPMPEPKAAEEVVVAAAPIEPVSTPEPTAIPEPEVEIPTASETALAKQEKMKSTTVEGTEETIVFRNILFDFDRSNLREESKNELNKISDYMSRKQAIDLRIDGHADWIGSVEYNLALSEKRAKSAYEYLLGKGLTSSRLTYQYFGEAIPIAPNANPDGTDNPEGRQLNRRCEFKFDEKGTAQNVVLKF
jgi:outer membrane protein OmpA-like peptidoglycan-associated protein